MSDIEHELFVETGRSAASRSGWRPWRSALITAIDAQDASFGAHDALGKLDA